MSQMEELSLSVIIVTWNCGEKVHPTLDLLIQCQKYISLEVIVVDNGSQDGTVDKIRNEFSTVICLEEKENHGFAKAVNIGAKKARGDYLLLLNDDAQLEPEACRALLEKAEGIESLGVMGAQLIFPDGRLQNSVAAVPNLWTELFNKNLLKAVLPSYFPSRHQVYQEVTDVPSVIGACFLTKREVFTELGGLDEEFFFYLEETDYCVRSRSKGYRVVHNPFVRVIHEQGRSSRKVAVWSKLQYHRSLLTFFRKHKGATTAKFLKWALRMQHSWKLILTSLGLALSLGMHKRLRLKWATYVALLGENLKRGNTGP
jgi:GT2 family glycosyltransferase